MSQCHDETKQGFATYLLEHALEARRSAYVGEGKNRWPGVHRLDAAHLYRLVLEKGVPGHRYHAVSEDAIAVRHVAEAIARRTNLPVLSLPAEAAVEHFGWLASIAQMDVPASSVRTRQELGWRPEQARSFIDDVEHAELPVPAA